MPSALVKTTYLRYNPDVGLRFLAKCMRNKHAQMISANEPRVVFILIKFRALELILQNYETAWCSSIQCNVRDCRRL